MIKAYSSAKEYSHFQSIRPDYSKAVDRLTFLSKRFVPVKKTLSVIDLCSGTGRVSQKFAQNVVGVKKIVLVDINEWFLAAAKKSIFLSKEVVAVNKDVLEFETNDKFDLVFAIFAYHHIQDSRKIEFVRKVSSLLNKTGILVLAEIYFEKQNDCLKYYKDLFNSISKENQTSGLKQFIEETAKSLDFEFKVSKTFADKQFASEGFKLINEEKVWPVMDSGKNGMFVQVYST